MGLKCSCDRKTTYGLLKPYEKCKTCQYRAQKQMPNNCDYILITGHMRGCDPSRCKKYVKGDRLPWKDDVEGDNPRGWNHRVPYLQLGVKHGRK